MDYCASTPLDPKVFKAMEPYFKGEFGNAGSLHSWGQAAIKAVDDAREKVARAIGGQFEEIVFTGSATEANNLALRGVVKQALLFQQTVFRNQNSFSPAAKLSFPSPQQLRHESESKLVEAVGYSSKQLSEIKHRPRIIVSAIEHESVLETAKDLERKGVEVVYLPVDARGVVDLHALQSALNENTILVSIMYVNNVIGTIQPIVEISKIIKEFKEQTFLSKKSVSESERAWFRALREERGRELSGRTSGWASETPSFRERKVSDSVYPLFHTDAVQAFQYLDCNVWELNVDMMTLSAHKIEGPKGVGVLYTRVKLPGVITGGEQEFKMRAGTPNTPGIAGFGKAVEIAVKERVKNRKKVYVLRAELLEGIKKVYPDAQWNGLDFESKRARFAPHVANVFFPAHLAEDLLMQFDRAGVAVSAGAACSARALKSSHVLQAIGCAPDRITCSIRFSLGRETTQEEVRKVVKRLRKIIKR